MNTYASRNNRINRRMDSPNIQLQFQKYGVEKDDDDFHESQISKQRKPRHVRSNGNSSSRSERRSVGNDLELSPLQRTLQRSKSSSYSGESSMGSGSRSSGRGSSGSDKTTVESVIELLEILKSSPFTTEDDDMQTPIVTPTISTDHIRKPPSRTNSAEFYFPSRRNKRAGVRPVVRMMPKTKSSSMRDLYNEDGTTPEPLKVNSQNERWEKFNSSPARTPKSKVRIGKHNQDQNSPNLVSTIDDFINTSSKKESTREQLERRTDESCEGSFFQDVPSILGDFHVSKIHRRWSNETLDSSNRAVENHWRRSLAGRKPLQNDLVLHTSSKGNNENSRERQSRRSAGGKVHNPSTKEDYTGFFLTSPTEANVKHGYGITAFPDGRLFEGVYDHGLMVEGKMTYPAEVGGYCPTYVGKFDRDGLRCGKGIYTTSTTTFLGQFRDDQQHGSGILIYHDGNDGVDASQSRRFIGHWKHGRKHGYGKEILANGTIAQEGLWKAGYFAGNPGSPY